MKFASKSVLTLIAAGVFAVPMVSNAAVKSSQVDTERVVISYQMSDLRTAEGRATLEREIRGAANKVCGTVNYSKVRSLQGVSDSRNCYESAVSEALTNLGSGELQVSAR